MKTRSAIEICLPLVLFVAACVLSLPTLVIAFAWMTIGVVSLGHRPLESFPTDGIRREWLKGYSGAWLWFYHLDWWPWYMRSPLRDVADRIGSGRAVAVNDLVVERPLLVKLVHRAGKNPVDAVIGLPPPQCPIDARVVGFQDDLRHSSRSAAPSTDSPCTAVGGCS
ncbi:hypothetical protein [Paraburkholderia panacisoli]|uniref:hypothetical protein n=1 Tax=Paraburkholderia panacisoli TaxID=2603818 RepID=UPI00165F1C93|nr:hypothetical protein [Paraburkholderia panacisoli]